MGTILELRTQLISLPAFSIRPGYPCILAGYLLHPGIGRVSFTAAVMLSCCRGNAGPIITLLKWSREHGYLTMLWANARNRFTRRFMFLEYWAFIPIVREPALICQDGPSWLSNPDICLRTGFTALWLYCKVQFSKEFEAGCKKFVSKFCLWTEKFSFVRFVPDCVCVFILIANIIQFYVCEQRGLWSVWESARHVLKESKFCSERIFPTDQVFVAIEKLFLI